MAERNTAITGKQIRAAVAADGLMKDVNQNLAVDVSDFAGTGLEDDGSENLRLAAQGDGIDGGAGSTLSVDVTDFIATAYGLEENTNDIRVNIDPAFFEFSVASGDVGAITLSDNVITEVKLAITGGPSNGYFLKYVTDHMEWASVTDIGFAKTDVITNEVPTGDINNTNPVYDLAFTPATGTLQVYLNGILQEPGSGKDYLLSGDDVTFAQAPNTGDILLVSYIKA